MISVETVNLTKRFGETTALDRLNLTVNPGEIFFLLGPSGCGKTTLLRTIAGFYAPDEGRILFGEEDVTRLPPHQRNTGMMFQSYALWPHLNVEKNVAFGLEERKVPKAERAARVREALESVQMGRLANRKINQLSGGQQQRVALARAMVVRPRCLLLDEPLSNLDAKLRLEMRGEIRSACKDHGLTAIYVTHDQKEALSIADRLAIMQDGRIRQIGTPTEIYHHPRTAFVAEFIGETNFVPGEVVGRNAGKVTVKTVLGTFEAARPDPDWQPAAGDRAQLSVRPESLSVKVIPNAGFSAEGEVVESIYLGETVQYQFQSGSVTLKVVELNPRAAGLARGQRCTVSALADDVIALPGHAS